MPLTTQQTQIIDSLLSPHFKNLAGCKGKSRKLKALRLAVKKQALDMQESCALSSWMGGEVPLLPTIVSLRGLQQNIAEVPGIGKDCQEEAREYIAEKIRSRVKSLKKNKVGEAELPELTEASLNILAGCVVACFAENIGKALQMVGGKASEIIHSDDKRIRYAINYAVVATMRALMRGTENSEIEIITAAALGGIGGAIVNALPKKYEDIADHVVDGAISGAVGNIKKGLGAVISAASLSSVVKGISSYFSKGKDLPDFADIAVTNVFAGDITNAIFGNVQKAAYKMMWNSMRGKDALRQRDMVGFLDAYFHSFAFSQISTEIFSTIALSVVMGVQDYIKEHDKNSQDVNKANVIKDFNNNFNLVAELENQGWQHFLDINGYTPQLNNASVKVDFLPSSPVAASEQKMIGSIGKNALSGVDITSLAMASYLAKKILRPAANISVSASKVVSSKINTRE
jgi:hypothetical protein